MSENKTTDYIQKRKNEVKKLIEELREDIKILSGNIEKCESILEKINNEEDAEKYRDFFDIEKGLQHIELF